MRNRELLTLPVSVDRREVTPLHAQIAEQLRSAIETGALSHGRRLPSTRTLAETLGVSRSVTSAAYLELFSSGHLIGRVGAGTYVAYGTPGAERARPPDRRIGCHQEIIDLRPGRVGMAGFPVAAWRAAWHRASHRPPHSAECAAIEEGLRRALAAHLHETRGLTCTPQAIVLSTGIRQSVDMLTRVTVRPGDRVAVEDPGQPWLRDVVSAYGAEIVPIPVDGDGMVVEALPASIRMVVVTPSLHVPLGVRLSDRRRRALVRLARGRRMTVIEIDRGSEFGYGVPPLNSLMALNGGGPEVCYVNSLSAALTPTLGVGYSVTHAGNAARLLRLRAVADGSASLMTHRAVSHLLDAGQVAAHLRRMNAVYARSRRAVMDALAGAHPGAEVLGAAAGPDVALLLPEAVECGGLARDLADHGVRIGTFHDYSWSAGRAGNGIVIGIGGVDEASLRRGLRMIAFRMSRRARRAATVITQPASPSPWPVRSGASHRVSGTRSPDEPRPSSR
ncbi:PLP-dependent aminotransferase family protein [Nonomuraea lactucae]|uniref:aminotransferase-like domain-containing protein n=1 Tax=Nonomuraea lactucae TaxID=2249762 RepID=UPI0013B3B3E5|nr:PLP-dependent aminotransferase family protein [Nonomuraea lactucae]